MRLFVVAAPGLEPVVADELRELGRKPAAVEGGLECDGDERVLAHLNVHLRTASRVLVRVASFEATTFADLERHARRIDWDRWIGVGRRAAFRVTCRKSRLYHSDAVAERFERAANRADSTANRPREAGERYDPSEQIFVARFFRDECTVSADSSGDHLHRRGWKLASGKAPLRENIAAAMLRGSRWRGHAPLIDPFCGSGTIPIEGALIARRIAPGSSREFAFTHWPSFEPGILARVLAESAGERDRGDVPGIRGSDRDRGAITAARANALRAGVAEDVRLIDSPLSALDVTAEPGWIVTNPPYGHRIVGGRDLRDLYARFGQIARALSGWRVVLLSPERALERATGIPFEELFRTTNGGIRVRCVFADI